MNRCLKSIALVALVCAATIGEAAGAAHIVPNQYAVAVLDQGGDTNDVEGAIYIEALEAGGSSIKGAPKFHTLTIGSPFLSYSHLSIRDHRPCVQNCTLPWH